MAKTYESGYDEKLGYNKHAFENPPPQLVVIGKTVKLIAAPIGLVSEAIHNYKDKKNGKSSSIDAGKEDEDATYVNLPPEEADALIKSGQAVEAKDKEATHELVPADQDVYDSDDDEADWILDEAAADIEKETDLAALEKVGYGKSLTDSKSIPAKPAKLPFPVVIPQRRPATKTRGFVRAYAPVLQDSGIDRDTFLQFLKDLHKNAQAAPIFKVITLGCNIAGGFPEPIVFGAAAAVQIFNEIGKEINERWKTNKFLEEANREIFRPRGLYAVVVTWKKSEDPGMISEETVDLGASSMAKYGVSQTDPAEGTERTTMENLKAKTERLRLAGAETKESEMSLECAELVFPTLDAVQDASEAKKGETQRTMVQNIKAKSRSSGKFINNYFDRRAHATYAAENPDGILTKQAAPIKPEFKSRYADPNNHTNKHFFTLITGGKYKAEPLGAKRRWEKAQRKAAEQAAKGLKKKPKQRRIGESVLYLAIVNMPTEEEIEKAKQKLLAAKEKKGEKKEGKVE